VTSHGEGNIVGPAAGEEGDAGSDADEEGGQEGREALLI
jgi:hypothetical protein